MANRTFALFGLVLVETDELASSKADVGSQLDNHFNSLAYRVHLSHLRCGRFGGAFGLHFLEPTICESHAGVFHVVLAGIDDLQARRPI